ncbi:MAG: hypothetical protein OXH23_10470 [bacterium]|nr:hypothetical protein [bacterium]
MAASEPIGERRRLALIQRLTEVLGEEEAATIMESLPPTYWQNIATKDDLKAQSDKVDGQFDKLKGEIALLIANQTRTLMITLAGFALSIWISLLVVGIT